MPIAVALEEELEAFCSRELGRTRPRYASGSSVDTENLRTSIVNKIYSRHCHQKVIDKWTEL